MPAFTRACFVFICVLGGAASVAAAPSTPTPSPAAPAAGQTKLPFRPAGVQGRNSAAAAEARRHFQQGVALHREGNVSGALAEFRAAHELWASAGATLDAMTALFNVGGLERDLLRYTDAIATLRRFLSGSASIPGATKSQLAELSQMRGDAQQLVTEMSALLAPITFVVKPPTAAVIIDGRGATVSPDVPLELAAGTHVVEVSADGHSPARREVAVVAGRAQRVEVALTPQLRTGSVVVTSNRPQTRVSIDGKDLGLAPVRVELPAGGHRLEATSLGYVPHRSEPAIGSGQSREIVVVLEPPPPSVAADVPIYTTWWLWGVLGAIAAGGVATALLVEGKTQGALDGSLTPTGRVDGN